MLLMWFCLPSWWATKGEARINVSKLHMSFNGFYVFPGPPFTIPELGSAFTIAYDSVMRSSLLENVSLEWSLVDSGCEPKQALAAVVTAKLEHGADVLIGE